MIRSLIIGASATCLLIGAGLLFADYDRPPTTLRAQAVPTATAAPAVPTEAARVPFCWPTPYARLSAPADDLAYLQATASGHPESGGYGMVRDAGYRFHEGVDIRPIGRDRKGEPTDAVLAACEGRLAYVNTRANGAYGKYVVMEHSATRGITLYTLYAHLAAVEPGIREGRTVPAGTRLGLMGRTDAHGGFPRERAHLHFEIGLRLSDAFHRWYANRRFPDANPHDNFNGINLAGLDPVAFYRFVHAHQGNPTADEVLNWVRHSAVTVVVETPSARKLPNFLRRNPALAPQPLPATPPAGWRIGFTAYGVPVRWEPLAAAPASARITLVDGSLGTAAKRRGLVTSTTKKSGLLAPGSTLETALALACD